MGIGIETACSMRDVYQGNKTIGEAAGDIAIAGFKGGVTGATSAAASTVAVGAAGSAISAAAATGIGSAVAGTAIGAVAMTAAPIAIGIGAPCLVGSFFSDLFD